LHFLNIFLPFSTKSAYDLFQAAHLAATPVLIDSFYDSHQVLWYCIPTFIKVTSITIIKAYVTRNSAFKASESFFLASLRKDG